MYKIIRSRDYKITIQRFLYASDIIFMADLRTKTREVLQLMEAPLQSNKTACSSGVEGPLSPSSGNARKDEASTTLSLRLNSLRQLRLQIEALARQHEEEEETLASAVHLVLSHTQTSHDTEVQALQKEVNFLRDEKIRIMTMFDKFKSEGDGVIQRMHETIQKLQSEVLHERQLRESVERECRDRLQHAKDLICRQQMELGASASNDEPVSTRLQEYEAITAQYSQYLEEAQVVIADLQRENEDLRASLSEHGDTDSSDSSLLRRYIERLREEKRNRIETEEQAERMLAEQRRWINALEQRLQTAERRGAVPPLRFVPEGSLPRQESVETEPDGSVQNDEDAGIEEAEASSPRSEPVDQLKALEDELKGVIEEFHAWDT
eukprot:PhM_4_TR9989/c0_g1_i1/m.67839